uniref:Chromo domain-containing protein n=1 Tax=Ananas comosus var. bracteatus TaxID=296719 RepID=A0A6V7PVY0_ANACO|nr:unnamed protein product [Ananas comosus var. bracteatus]
MVAIDESECSNYALRWALSNLREAISSSPLVIFNAQPFATAGYMTAAAYGAPPPELILSIQEHQKKVSLALLEKAKVVCAEQGEHSLYVKKEKCYFALQETVFGPLSWWWPNRSLTERLNSSHPAISSVERRVDEILANRVWKLPSGTVEREFLIKWKNLPRAEASWEPEDALRHEEDKIKEYQQKTLADTSG